MSKKLYRLSQILFIICLLSYIAFIYFKVDCYIDADDSSELLLANIINRDGNYFTNNWCYSTELRIFSSQLVLAPMFALTHSYFYTRLFSSIILMIILLISYYYLLKQYELEKYFYISASLLFLPISIEYFDFVYKGLYYILNIFVTFVTLGAIEKYIKTDKKIILVPIAILSLISNLNSFKQLFYTQAPLLGAAILLYLFDLIKKNDKKESFKYLISSFIMFVSGLIGYIIYKVFLTKIFISESYESIVIKALDGKRFINILLNFLKSYGLDNTQGIKYYLYLFTAILFVVLLIVSIIYLLFKSKDKKANRISLFTLISILLYLIVYNFTNVNAFSRYNLPIVLMVFPLMLLLFDKLNKEKLLYALIIFFVGVSSIRYISLCKYDDNYAEKDLVNYLLERGYYNGYAGFWSGNVLNELSKDQIDVYVYQITERNTIANTIFDLSTWLQDKSHFENPPSGKIFVLFDKSVEEDYAYFDFRSSEILYNTDRFLVFTFDSYEDLIKEMERIKLEG